MTAMKLKKKEMRFVDIASWSDEKMATLSRVDTLAERERWAAELSRPADGVAAAEVTRVAPMPRRLEAIAALVFGLGVPGFGIVFPLLVAALAGFWGWRAAAAAVAMAAPLAFLPYSFSDENLKLDRYKALLKYFSFKGVYYAGHAPWVKGKPCKFHYPATIYRYPNTRRVPESPPSPNELWPHSLSLQPV